MEIDEYRKKAAKGISEAEIKRGCEDFLQTEQNFGRLLYLRLNSGLTVITGDKKRVVKGCQKGTSDLYALRRGISWFIECKRVGKKPTAAQVQFAELVNKYDGIYIVVNHWAEIQNAFENMDKQLDMVAKRMTR